MSALNYPEPPEPEAFQGLAGKIVKTIEPHSEADPVAVLATLLAMVGNAAGPRHHARVERSQHPARLYFGIVGKTAKSRKGTSAGWPRHLLAHADEFFKERIIDGLSSGEGLIWQVRDPVTRKVDGEAKSVDDGVTDKRLMILEGELARTLKAMAREGNTLSTILRCAWDTGDLNNPTKNSPAKATGAHVSLVGHITQTELLASLTEVESANGFANRFIWLCAKRSKCLPFGGDLEDSKLNPYVQRLHDVLAFARTAGRVRWAEETQPLWANVYAELSEGKPGLIGALTARGEAQVLRLAVTYALLDRSSSIKPEHLEAALALWDYSLASVSYLFQGRSGNPLADDILEALQEAEKGLTRTGIRDLFSRNESSIAIETALELLRIHGFAHSLAVAPEGGKGRPVERWIIGKEATT